MTTQLITVNTSPRAYLVGNKHGTAIRILIAFALCLAAFAVSLIAVPAQAYAKEAHSTGYYTIYSYLNGTAYGASTVSISGGSDTAADWKSSRAISTSVSGSGFATYSGGSTVNYNAHTGVYNKTYYRYVTHGIYVYVPAGWHCTSYGTWHWNTYGNGAHFQPWNNSATPTNYVTSPSYGGAQSTADRWQLIYVTINLCAANMIHDNTYGLYNDAMYIYMSPNTYNQNIQVRYQNADGSWGDYQSVINTGYSYGSTVSWSRAQDATYKAASISYTAPIGDQTNYVDVYRKTATATVRYRLQNADGTYPSAYTTGATAVRCVGGSVTYTYAQTDYHQLTSGTATVAPAASATANPSDATVSLDVPRRTYTAYFDGNGGTDGAPITRIVEAPLGTLPGTSRTGFRHLGWFTDADGGTEVTAETTMPVGGATYHAHWDWLRGDAYLVKGDAQRGSAAQGDATLAGAGFDFYNANAYAVALPADGSSVPTGGLVCRIVTDAKGYASTAAARVNGWDRPAAWRGALQYGRYVVRESAPPDGYTANAGWSGSVEVADDYGLYEVS